MSNLARPQKREWTEEHGSTTTRETMQCFKLFKHGQRQTRRCTRHKWLFEPRSLRNRFASSEKLEHCSTVFPGWAATWCTASQEASALIRLCSRFCCLQSFLVFCRVSATAVQQLCCTCCFCDAKTDTSPSNCIVTVDLLLRWHEVVSFFLQPQAPGATEPQLHWPGLTPFLGRYWRDMGA